MFSLKIPSESFTSNEYPDKHPTQIIKKVWLNFFNFISFDDCDFAINLKNVYLKLKLNANLVWDSKAWKCAETDDD
jgi:hypothetical protein